MKVTYHWRGAFTNTEVNTLHTHGFGQEPGASDVWERLNSHSLGWVCARTGTELMGFVNVAWAGGVHAFVLDTVVCDRYRRTGVGSDLVGAAVREARTAGCLWLHVDFEDHLCGFYLQSCGFTPTRAGLIAL